MSLLNRPPEFDYLYDTEGRLQGGLSALEELAQVIAIGSGNDDEADDIDDENEELEPAHEFPVSAAHTASSLDSDDDMSDDEPGSSDDEAMEEIAMDEEPRSQEGSSSSLPETPLERFPSATLSSSPMQSPSLDPTTLTSFQRHSSTDSEHSLTRQRSRDSRRSSRRSVLTETAPGPPVLGERLKLRFLDTNVASTLLVSVAPCVAAA
jgi:serine/threonine-protein phosphatase 6 regulatory subunit 3